MKFDELIKEYAPASVSNTWTTGEPNPYGTSSRTGTMEYMDPNMFPQRKPKHKKHKKLRKINK